MTEKIYIAGKTVGDDGYITKFERARERLLDEGYVVLNPAVLPSGISAAEDMRLRISMLDVADRVAFLPDFLESPGALVEFTYATYIKKPYIFIEEAMT